MSSFVVIHDRCDKSYCKIEIREKPEQAVQRQRRTEVEVLLKK